MWRCSIAKIARPLGGARIGGATHSGFAVARNYLQMPHALSRLQVLFYGDPPQTDIGNTNTINSFAEPRNANGFLPPLPAAESGLPHRALRRINVRM